jgi:hypothetical protein
MNTMAREYRALALASAVAIFLFAASLASATIVGRAVALEELALEVDLVCKATVVADRVITDERRPCHHR